MIPVVLVQLPFPSTSDPHPTVAAYYRDYSKKFASLIEDYFVPEGALWEMPLWVAHLAGMLKALGRVAELLDLSRSEASADACADVILRSTKRGSLIMLSPLAQNFQLALEVSSRLVKRGRWTLLGGNMAPLAEPGSVSLVCRGLLDVENLAMILQGLERGSSLVEIQPARRGRVCWTPDYTLLGAYHGRVPLLRLSASHGCLYTCAFCGDAWSRKLYVVDRSSLEAEVSQFEELFPSTKLIYVGDKTFGQSPEAVENLLAVFRSRSQYRFIVQTHIRKLESRVVEIMEQLKVLVVEIGFESADLELLHKSGKGGVTPAECDLIFDRLRSAGIRVVLNVLGGLPRETGESHDLTVAAVRRWGRMVWLYNLYNFVPYPLTPYFPELRERIFDWNFQHWREDGPPVFAPYHQTVEESWARFLCKVAVAHDAIRAEPDPPAVRQTVDSVASRSKDQWVDPAAPVFRGASVPAQNTR